MTRRFAVFGLPAPQGSKRHVGEGRMVESSKRVKPWRRQVAAAYADHSFGDMLDGPVSVTVDFYLPRPKAHYSTGRNAGALKPSAPAEHLTMPDLDKLTRAVGDALMSPRLGASGWRWRASAQGAGQGGASRPLWQLRPSHRQP